MKTKLFLIILILKFLLSTTTYAQSTFHKTFGGTYYDIGNSVQQTKDGGYIVAGVESDFGAGGRDVYLIKTNAYGDTLWTRSFGGAGDDYGTSVQQTIDSGYIVTGYTNSFGAGFDDVYLIKTDSKGNTLWTKNYGGAKSAVGESVQQTSDGGYIVVGYTDSFGAGDNDIYVIKTNPNGDIIWTRTFGGTSWDWGTSIRQTADGGYIIAGSTDSEACLIKTDANGNIIWAKTYGNADSGEANSIQLTTDGGYIVVGDVHSGFNPYVLIFKTDMYGNILWAKKCNGGYGKSVQETTDGGYMVSGSSGSSLFLIKTNPIGDLVWRTFFYGNYYADGGSALQTMDGGYIITGKTHRAYAGEPVYLIKTDSIGNSGCNQTYDSVSVMTPSIIVSIPIMQVSSGGIIGNPATIIGYGGDVSDTCTPVGITPQIIIESNLFIFPNPFSSVTILKSNKVLNDATITVYNSYGQQVKQIKDIFGQKITLFRDNLPIGIYFLRLTDSEKTYEDKLVITDN